MLALTQAAAKARRLADGRRDRIRDKEPCVPCVRGRCHGAGEETVLLRPCPTRRWAPGGATNLKRFFRAVNSPSRVTPAESSNRMPATCIQAFSASKRAEPGIVGTSRSIEIYRKNDTPVASRPPRSRGDPNRRDRNPLWRGCPSGRRVSDPPTPMAYGMLSRL